MTAENPSAVRQATLIVAVAVAVYGQLLVHANPNEPFGWLLLGIAAVFAAVMADLEPEPTAAVDEPAPATVHPVVRLVCAALAVGAIAATTVLSTLQLWPVLTLLLWLASGLPATLAVRGWRLSPPRRPALAWTGREVGALAAVLALAALARLLWIDSLPRAYFGDEPRVGMYLYNAYNGGRIPNFFSMGWNTWPVVGLSLQGLFAPVLGIHMTTLRLSSVLMGTLSVLTTYLLARELLGARAALIGAVLLAIGRTAIDFGRIGVAHAQVLCIEPLAFYFLWRALNGGRAVHYLWAGIATGWCLFSYNAGQLVPPLVFGWLLLGALRHPGAVRSHWRGAALLATAFALTLFPYLYYFTDEFSFGPNWGQWTIMARNRQTMSRVAEVYASSGLGPAWEVLSKQIWTTWLGFGVLPGGGYPLGYRRGGMLDDVSAALFMLGMAIALRHLLRSRFAFLSYWWVGTVIAGGIMTIDPPSFVRMVGLLPVLAILAALPLEWIARNARDQIGQAVAALAVVGLIGAAGWENWRTYFVEFAQQPGDQVSELARYFLAAPPNSRLALIGVEHHISAHNELFIIEFDDRARGLPDPAHAVPIRQPVTEPLIIALSSTQTTLAPYIRSVYPEAEISDTGADGRPLPFRAVHLAPEAVAARAGLAVSATRDGAAPVAAGIADPFGASPNGTEAAHRLVWTGSVYWPHDKPLGVVVDAGQPTTVTVADAPPISADGQKPTPGIVTLPRGWQPLRIEEQVGDGPRRLAIFLNVQGTTQQVTRWNLRPDVTREGLSAFYQRPDGMTLQVIDPQLNAFAVEDRFQGNDVPFMRMPFTVSWRGALRVDRPGRYEFEAIGSGPYTITLDGEPLLAAKVDVPEQPASTQAVRVLEAGHHPIAVEWDSTKPAHTSRRLFQLFWKPPGGEKELVPPTNFVRDG
jgi:hypothetical protein